MQASIIPALPTEANVLKAEDSILEPETVDALSRFIDGGGQPEMAKEFLCESYEGTADSINLAVLWLEAAGGDGDAVIDESVKQQLLHSFSATMADDAFLKRTGSGGRAPTFLDEINRSSTWQPVVKELANKHKSSVVLFYMKQRDGFSALDAAIADSPEKFIQSFVKLLEDLVSRPSVSEADLRAFYDVACQRASFDENTLVLALRLIEEIIHVVEDPNLKSVLRRCSQEIRLFARKSMVQVAQIPDHIALQFSTRIAIAIGSESSSFYMSKGVISAISTILSTDKAKAKKQIGGYKEEINLLRQVYQPLIETGSVERMVENANPTGQQEALVEALCHPEVFDEMIRLLFVQSARGHNVDTGRKAPVDEDVRDCLCFLVSIATVAIRDKVNNVSQPDGFGQTFRRDVKECEKLLKDCVKCCENLFPGCPRKTFEKGLPLQTLQEGIRQSPVIASGIVRWAREGLLKDPDPKILVRTAVKYLALLEFVGEQHVSLREEVLALFADSYGRQLYAKNDVNRVVEFEVKLRSLYSEGLVCLFRQRMATRVLQIYRARFAEDENIDRSFLRKFVGDVLEIAAPKYSGPFAAALLDLLAHQRVVDALVNRTTRDRDVNSRVIQFLNDIEDATTLSQLDSRVIALVQRAYKPRGVET